MASCCVCCCEPVMSAKSIGYKSLVPQRRARNGAVCVPRRGDASSVKSSPSTYFRAFCAPTRASMVDSYESSSDFVKRTEQAWLISQQPRPVGCSSCDSNGHVECKWCGGTGFFILGDNMLCQVPSRNSSCVICCGKGSTCCSDCKGTGFRAVWLGKPPISK